MDFQPIIKWVGSKRIQSEEIVQYFPDYIDTYYEPFCGGCSVLFQLLKSKNHKVNRCVCSDINGDLIDLWNTIKKDPDGLFQEYSRMWEEMNSLPDRQDKKKYFEMVRDEFNQTRSPYSFFFLMRTCTNGIPRYNRFGEFNNTFHITRDGIKPKRLKKVLYEWSRVLNKYNVLFKRCDYKMMLEGLNLDDFVYLDPPYEMTRSTGKYFGSINYQDMFYRLGVMAERGIHFGLSFDSTDGILTVPEDCYINHVDITSRPGGYRRTKLKMDNKDKYENLYLN
jgi:DNA adenine methylase